MGDAAPTVLEEYQSRHGLHRDFTERLEGLIRDLLNESGIPVHSVTSRVKDRESLSRKLGEASGKYLKIDDVTDICGVRIITYFADEVDLVAGVIERELKVDRANSVDKRALLDPDRFGYISLHYVAGLPGTRLQHTELKRFSSCQAEIQIRSILQHAWAEIEHDLGYKSKDAVPREIRRRFSRLAGLLELADQEFGQIRDDLSAYEKAVPGRIASAPSSVPIDQASLHAFATSNEQVRELNELIATLRGTRVVEVDQHVFGPYARNLRDAGLETIADLDLSLKTSGGLLARFAKSFATNSRSEITSSLAIVYLWYVLMAKNNSVQQVEERLKGAGIPWTPNQIRRLAERIVSAYEHALEESDGQ